MNPPIKDWRGKRVWIVGASSGIGHALADLLDTLGARVCVSARNQQSLNAFVANRPNALAIALDVTQPGALALAFDQLTVHEHIDLIVYCAGHYTAMRAQDFDLEDARKHFDINYLGVLNLLDACLPKMTSCGKGHFSVVSSVAGYSGLPKSLAYGPTKAALIHLAEVLYLDLHPLGIGVSVINPGFVQTPLTAQNTFHMPALLTPEQAAREIVDGYRKGEFEIHFPKRFSRFLKLLRLLPYSIYFTLIGKLTGL
jgi:short-subunit dehydrogenase